MLLTAIAARVNGDMHEPFLKSANAERLMLKLIVAYKYATCQSILSISLQCQLAALSNHCNSEIAFARLSVISALNIPADFSRLVPVRTMQCQWHFQAPTGELIN